MSDGSVSPATNRAKKATSVITFFFFRILASEETSTGTPGYKTHMRLTIFNVNQDDYGMYKCVAKNPRGETDGTIRVYSK